MTRRRKDVGGTVIIPLLHTLRTLTPQQRVIILAHLDDVSRDQVCEAITNVLTSEKLPMKEKLRLRSELMEYKDHLRCLTNRKKSSRAAKKKVLLQMGGGPMSRVLTATCPHLLHVYKK